MVELLDQNQINIIVGSKFSRNNPSKVKVFGKLNYESHLARARKKLEDEEKLQQFKTVRAQAVKKEREKTLKTKEEWD